MDIKKIIFVAPPRYLHPFFNESDNFLLPLGLPYLAAALRNKFPDIEIKIIDCPVLKIGWDSLSKILLKENPDVIGAGEKAMYYHEVIKLFRLAKNIKTSTITIAGGHFFSWMTDYSLKNFPVDIIVRFEGENTIVDLIKTMIEGGDLSSVKGIAYKIENKIKKNSLRNLIDNLDDLPLPAFDLMPMNKYSPRGYLWPRSVTLEHSRGCIDQCNFCSLWTFWGKHIKTDIEDNQLEVTPRYRPKSVERTLEEVDIVYKKYNRKYIYWVDPTFNVDPGWNEAFCDGLLKRKYKDLYWWAYIRADFALRDERLGILEKMVKAGLIHSLIGIERCCSEDLNKVKKSNYTRESIKEVFAIFKRKYPQVFRQGTFLTCLPFDTKASMLNLARYSIELDIEDPAFIPVSPVPGTYLYQEAKINNILAEEDFSRFNWTIPVLDSYAGLTRLQLAKLCNTVNRIYMFFRPFRLVRGLFSPYKHKRGIYWWCIIATLKMKLFDLLNIIINKNEYRGGTLVTYMKKPKWYD